MSVDNIIAKISADADTECAQIKEDAQKKAQEFEKKALLTAKEAVREITDRAEADAGEIERRQMLIFELESRKNELAVRRAMIDEAFAAAGQKLGDLSAPEWEELIARLIARACETGRERLRVPSGDRTRYECGFLTKLNNQLKARGKQGGLTLDDSPAAFSGGVLIIGESGDYDASFDALLKNARYDYEKMAADILFTAEV